MTTNHLNQNLYSRFGLELNIQKVHKGFQSYTKRVLLETLNPIVHPNGYKDPNDLYKARAEIIRELCRQLFIDFDDYNHTDYGLEWFIEKELCDEFRGSFEEYLLRLQVLLNIVYSYKIISYEFNQLLEKLNKYINDFPFLGIMIKVYKTKSPQILPTTSKKFEQEIGNTLGLLELKKEYEHVLSHFESGLKEFLTAKNKSEYKDVIEDMYTSCDEMVKVVLNNKSKGLRHISDKNEAKFFGLNGHQKELYKNFRNWVDEIKHGTIKDFSKEDTEMIISLTASLIRFVLSRR